MLLNYSWRLTKHAQYLIDFQLALLLFKALLLQFE
jgi:hypothetical protein